MGFGVELGKSVAKTGANMLTGGIVNGIMGLFGGSKKAEQRQYQHEKVWFAVQQVSYQGKCYRLRSIVHQCLTL